MTDEEMKSCDEDDEAPELLKRESSAESAAESAGENAGNRKVAWTAAEDAVLRSQVESQAPTLKRRSGAWAQVALHLPGRSGKQCRERWCYNLSPRIRKEPWTLEEDAVLAKAQANLGNRWALIARSLPGRTENGVKIRFKSLQRARRRWWTEEEDARLLTLHTAVGPRWSDIAALMPGRSANSVRARWLATKRGEAQPTPAPGAPEQILFYNAFYRSVQVRLDPIRNLLRWRVGEVEAPAPKSPLRSESPPSPSPPHPPARRGTSPPAMCSPPPLPSTRQETLPLLFSQQQEPQEQRLQQRLQQQRQQQELLQQLLQQQQLLQEQQQQQQQASLRMAMMLETPSVTPSSASLAAALRCMDAQLPLPAAPPAPKVLPLASSRRADTALLSLLGLGLGPRSGHGADAGVAPARGLMAALDDMMNRRATLKRARSDSDLLATVGWMPPAKRERGMRFAL